MGQPKNAAGADEPYAGQERLTLNVDVLGVGDLQLPKPVVPSFRQIAA